MCRRLSSRHTLVYVLSRLCPVSTPLHLHMCATPHTLTKRVKASVVAKMTAKSCLLGRAAARRTDRARGTRVFGYLHPNTEFAFSGLEFCFVELSFSPKFRTRWHVVSALALLSFRHLPHFAHWPVRTACEHGQHNTNYYLQLLTTGHATVVT